MTISIAVKKKFISRASPENKPFYTAISIVFLSEIKNLPALALALPYEKEGGLGSLCGENLLKSRRSLQS